MFWFLNTYCILFAMTLGLFGIVWSPKQSTIRRLDWWQKNREKTSYLIYTNRVRLALNRSSTVATLAIRDLSVGQRFAVNANKLLRILRFKNLVQRGSDWVWAVTLAPVAHQYLISGSPVANQWLNIDPVWSDSLNVDSVVVFRSPTLLALFVVWNKFDWLSHRLITGSNRKLSQDSVNSCQDLRSGATERH